MGAIRSLSFGRPLLAEAYWAAIATLVVMQSTLGATLLISIERIAATALGCSGWRAPGKLFHGESLGLCGGGICAGTLVRGVSHGENRVSVCRRHARHYRAYSAFTRCMDRCPSLLL
jgi:Fusaric acid resistance protein-like